MGTTSVRDQLVARSVSARYNLFVGLGTALALVGAALFILYARGEQADDDEALLRVLDLGRGRDVVVIASASAASGRRTSASTAASTFFGGRRGRGVGEQGNQPDAGDGEEEVQGHVPWRIPHSKKKRGGTRRRRLSSTVSAISG